MAYAKKNKQLACPANSNELTKNAANLKNFSVSADDTSDNKWSR